MVIIKNFNNINIGNILSDRFYGIVFKLITIDKFGL